MKMLLVGELNEVLRSLSECLSEGFTVQLCSDNAANVKDMIRLLRPSIVVVNVMEIKPEITEIFTTIADKLTTMPMVIIGTAQIQNELAEQSKALKNKIILSRPLGATEVLRNCYKLVNKEISVDEQIEWNGSSEKKDKKILVVDDNALVLRNTKTLLESKYQVALANTGMKALEIIKNDKIDLVLLDYAMPGMDGREVFERIISDEEKKNIPVVFLTSVSEKSQIYEVLKNKPYGYILKPPSMEKIMSVIEEALG